MRVSIIEAEATLNDLVRRAEAGEEVVITRGGQPAVCLVPARQVKRERSEDIDKIIREIQESAAAKRTDGPDAARSQDFLYDEDGLFG
mgnify:CR=1 FL=1